MIYIQPDSLDRFRSFVSDIVAPGTGWALEPGASGNYAQLKHECGAWASLALRGERVITHYATATYNDATTTLAPGAAARWLKGPGTIRIAGSLKYQAEQARKETAKAQAQSRGESLVKSLASAGISAYVREVRDSWVTVYAYSPGVSVEVTSDSIFLRTSAAKAAELAKTASVVADWESANLPTPE